MKDTPVISVIVPVYNVENYITNCVESLINQTYSNFEAIFIDDGSQDRSVEVLIHLIENIPNFKLLKQKNYGQAIARNNGIKEAQGSYLAFLDSDDYYSPLYLEKMLNEILREKADIVSCGMAFVTSEKEIIKTNITEPALNNGLLALQKLLLSHESLPSVCNKLFKKSLFIDISFPEGIYFEDLVFMCRIFLKVKKISNLSDILYFYTQKIGSTMHTISREHLLDRSKAFVFIREDLIESQQFRRFETEYHIGLLLMGILSAASDIVRHSSSPLEELNSFRSENVVQSQLKVKSILTVKRVSSIKMIALIILKISPYLFLRVAKKFL
tara:strand:+ start:1630 stop:2613 length:984 start_codon:yes stop_codon:yes gene_type:complete